MTYASSSENDGGEELGEFLPFKVLHNELSDRRFEG